jgi:DNA adenine methylase
MTIIKYVGSKLQFVDHITGKMPPKHGLDAFGDYHEPFCGSMAIALNMITGDRVSYLSDICPELINMWLCVQFNPSKVFSNLMAIGYPKCKEDYEAVRTAYNKAKCLDLANGAQWIANLSLSDRLTLAAQYIWLNKTKFNGLQRVNKKGEDNVGWNKELNPCFPKLSQLENASYTLRNAHITCQSYVTALDNIKPNDLVYCDPPYIMTFNGYTSDRFEVNSQVLLFEILENLAAKGVHVFASNSESDYVRNLYRDWDITELRRKGTMSCKGGDRGKVAELLMTKYQK